MVPVKPGVLSRISSISCRIDASERLCSDPHDGVVEVFLSNGSACPADTEPHRDLLGMGIACVRRLTTSGAVAPLGEVGNSEAG